MLYSALEKTANAKSLAMRSSLEGRYTTNSIIHAPEGRARGDKLKNAYPLFITSLLLFSIAIAATPTLQEIESRPAISIDSKNFRGLNFFETLWARLTNVKFSVNVGGTLYYPGDIVMITHVSDTAGKTCAQPGFTIDVDKAGSATNDGYLLNSFNQPTATLSNLAWSIVPSNGGYDGYIWTTGFKIKETETAFGTWDVRSYAYCLDYNKPVGDPGRLLWVSGEAHDYFDVNAKGATSCTAEPLGTPFCSGNTPMIWYQTSTCNRELRGTGDVCGNNEVCSVGQCVPSGSVTTTTYYPPTGTTNGGFTTTTSPPVPPTPSGNNMMVGAVLLILGAFIIFGGKK